MTHACLQLMASTCVCSSRPLIMASAGDGPSSEYELAAAFYQIRNRRAADGAAYITVRVLPSMMVRQLWLHFL